MTANYHTHTWRCNHAEGTERSYVESAIASGKKILGFSDHSPQCFPDGYVSGFRMKLSQLEGYVQTIMELKNAYTDRIEIHLGVELEYYPVSFPELMPILRDTPVEYALLGQHYLGSEMNDRYSGAPTEDEHDLIRYCRQVREAMETGVFTYLAHPDLFRFVGDRKVYRTHMAEICRSANSCGRRKLPGDHGLRCPQSRGAQRSGN